MNHLPRNAEILAGRLVEARGISPDEAVILALEETLARTPAGTAAEPRLEGDADPALGGDFENGGSPPDSRSARASRNFGL